MDSGTADFSFSLTMMKLLLLASFLSTVAAFVPAAAASKSVSVELEAVPSHLVIPDERDTLYGNGASTQNVAQYLMDLHDNEAVFDFCGGMMFQLVLTDALYAHLKTSVDSKDKQPKIFDANHMRMHSIPGYQQNADADNLQTFHGREMRKVPNAAGGMGFVMQLSLANADDPDGWSAGEVEDYNGWGSDTGRPWRKAADYANEGFKYGFPFGQAAFGLHHRCYLHLDGLNRMWLSAEDGCEGTPALMSKPAGFSFSNIFDSLKM